jgi:hypothetical protein
MTEAVHLSTFTTISRIQFFFTHTKPSLTAVMFPEYLAVGKTATGKTKTLWEIRGGEPQPSLVHISVKYDVRFFTKYIAKVTRMLERGNDSPIHRKSDSLGADCKKKMTRIFKSFV